MPWSARPSSWSATSVLPARDDDSRSGATSARTAPPIERFSSSAWSCISATSGETTIVTPGRTSAGSWKQKLLPNPVGSSPSTLRPSATARISGELLALRSSRVVGQVQQPCDLRGPFGDLVGEPSGGAQLLDLVGVSARLRMRRVCGSSVCASSASSVDSSAARCGLSRPWRAKNAQMRRHPSAIVVTLPPVGSPVSGSQAASSPGVEGAEERLPVGAAQCGGPGELAVGDDDDAAVPFGADEPADRLPQLQRGQRQVVRLGRDCVRVFGPASSARVLTASRRASMTGAANGANGSLLIHTSRSRLASATSTPCHRPFVPTSNPPPSSGSVNCLDRALVAED